MIWAIFIPYHMAISNPYRPHLKRFYERAVLYCQLLMLVIPEDKDH